MLIDEKIELLSPVQGALGDFLFTKKTLATFDQCIRDFIDRFAKEILKDPQLKIYPDLVSLAFWMRKKNIAKLESAYASNKKGVVKVSVGRVIHFAPSNVDTIFIYSLFLSLMVGNQNIVRVSSKTTPQRDILINLLCKLLNLDEFKGLQSSLLIVNYPHSDEITEYLCSSVDLRVIWGGDDTVNSISSLKLPPTANEIKFANKYSLAFIDAASLSNLAVAEFDNLVANFVNDCFWFSQQGCSSPRTVIWKNQENFTNEIEKFWSAVSIKAEAMFSDQVDIADIINKLVASNLVAIHTDSCIINTDHWMATRLQIEDLKVHNSLRELHCGAGLFLECGIKSVFELANIVDRKTQTIGYFGFDVQSLKKVLLDEMIYVDRIVPLGSSLEFDVIWDGYDLLESMSRNVSFK